MMAGCLPCPKAMDTLSGLPAKPGSDRELTEGDLEPGTPGGTGPPPIPELGWGEREEWGDLEGWGDRDGWGDRAVWGDLLGWGDLWGENPSIL